VPAEVSLRDRFERGLAAPICLTWELTYACNLACTHCLSSSGRRDPNELTTSEALALIDEIAAMQIFYINIGGGEPMIRSDFFTIVEHAVAQHVGVKFSTNGTRVNAAAARRLAATPYLDIQVSIDGADAATNDRLRGDGSYLAARRAMDELRDAEFGQFKISVVMTRESVEQLDEFESLAQNYGAELRLTRLRPSGRGVAVWDELRPSAQQNRDLYHWLLKRPNVLTGDSFFHLSALGEPLEGLNLCGAGRVVCLIDPVGNVYACPFVIHEEFLAGNIRPQGFSDVWTNSELFASLRAPGSAGACGSCGSYDACRGGCMAAKFFSGLELDDPDPECVFGHGETALATKRVAIRPTPSPDHSRRTAVSLGAR
jgi:mycofactocin radical SAM maturase